MRQLPFLIFTSIFASSLVFATNESNYTICTESDCPTIPTLVSHQKPLENQAIIYQSTRDKGFMMRSEQDFSDANNGGWQYIVIDQNKFTDTYPVIGFGGAFTDSSSHLYHHMSDNLKKRLMMAYYSAEGIHYTLGRVPIASTDFSCREVVTIDDSDVIIPSLNNCDDSASQYSYAETPDNNLSNFKLVDEDIRFKIPMLKDAMATADTPIHLFASAWSAPAWMKTNGNMVQGYLQSPFQSVWAKYIVKFLKMYQYYGINFWGITVQNEPVEANLPGQHGLQTWQSMYYTKEEEANFIKNYLGPAIKSLEKEYGEPIRIISHDDQIATIADRSTMITDPELAQYISGMGLHWYMNYPGFFGRLDQAYETLNATVPGTPRFILATEACEGYLSPDRGPILGDWSRGESYAHDIINDFNHHVSGWVDWNLVLDSYGGPTWAKNFVDSPMLVDIASQTLVFQPMYYFLGHFSKFIIPDSKMLASESNGWFALEEITFKVPPQNNLPETIVVVVLNRDMTGRKYYLQDQTDPNAIRYLNMEIPAHSIQTIIYRAGNK